MQPITMRAATEADGPVLTRLIRDSDAYTGEYHVMVARQVVDGDYVRAHPVRVASRGAGVVGFYSLLVPGRGESGEAEVDFMFVDNASRSQGIGRLLVDDLLHQASRLNLTRLHIVSHPPSEAFYAAVGARRIGTLPPSGRVTWSRPILVLDVPATRSGNAGPVPD